MHLIKKSIYVVFMLALTLFTIALLAASAPFALIGKGFTMLAEQVEEHSLACFNNIDIFLSKWVWANQKN